MMDTENLINQARKQHDQLRAAMAPTRWHLYRLPSGHPAIMQEGAHWDIPEPPILVPNVHAMDSIKLARLIRAKLETV
jgi:hypothetical protein